MLNEKYKENTKYKSEGKSGLLRKRLCAEVSTSTQQKSNNNDYMNEIFAGLMWLG